MTDPLTHYAEWLRMQQHRLSNRLALLPEGSSKAERVDAEIAQIAEVRTHIEIIRNGGVVSVDNTRLRKTCL